MKKYSKRFLLTTAFVCGMSIMAVEISASRLLAPFFGTSLFVWTNIIGVVMVALSLGYYYGGKLADKNPDLKVLLKMIFLAGIIFLVIPWIVKPIASFVTFYSMVFASASVIVFVGSFLVTLLLYGFPIFILGTVSPFIIKLYSLEDKMIGEVAGNVFSVSTIGSIIGTFIPTLWFIPVFGTRITISIFAIALICIASYGLVEKKIYLISLVLLFFPLRLLQATSPSDFGGSVFETIEMNESAYQFIQIVENKHKERFLVYNEGMGLQSYYHPDKILSGGMYFDYFNLLPYLFEKEDSFDFLILGLAGGTISRQLNYFFEDRIQIDGVEIDKKVIDVAKEHLELDNPQLNIYNQDGRIYLKSNEKKYDVVIVDAYSQESYIPWTMVTHEFWQETKDNLQNDGIVAINVNATGENSELLVSIINTMGSVFKNVYRAKVDEEDGFNYMILATENDLNFESLRKDVEFLDLEPLAELFEANVYPIEFDPSRKILTDDWSPTELMTDTMFFKHLVSSSD